MMGYEMNTSHVAVLSLVLCDCLIIAAQMHNMADYAFLILGKNGQMGRERERDIDRQRHGETERGGREREGDIDRQRHGETERGG